MFRIYFSNIGKDKWSNFIEVNVETLEDAENTALFECRKHLESSLINLEYIGAMLYNVDTGFDIVGQIMIRSI